jgi:superfamily II DNA/RNA helicase|tara:strand:- start:248 stop:1402 length:1155 start_codon:yes stop_codon:yes gene_type:complete
MNKLINTKKWDYFNLKDDLLKGIYAYGFDNPSEIQQQSLPPILNKNDVFIQAQSGSGKTGTFSISILQLINTNIKKTQAIIVAPTRELAKQISYVIKTIGQFINHLQIKTLIGGDPIHKDIAYFKHKTPHIIVGCIGRINDLCKRKYLTLSNVKLLCLDEADELLSNNFKNHIKELYNNLDPSTQNILFSATITPESSSIVNHIISKNPTIITVKNEDLTLECIQQFYLPVNGDLDKYNSLKYLFNQICITQSIIYVNNIDRVKNLYDSMIKENFPVCCIHGNLSKIDRDKILQDFRNGTYRVLISSNITARGIDIQQVGLVINFDVTSNVNTYLHRIGRSGRWGRKGIAVNFITRKDIFAMKKIEKHYKINIPELKSEEQLKF